MRFPDAVSILRPNDATNPDAYGNPGWSTPVAAQAYVTREAAYFAPGTVLDAGDRIVTSRGTFAVEADPGRPHTPSGRLVPVRVKLVRLPDGA